MSRLRNIGPDGALNAIVVQHLSQSKHASLSHRRHQHHSFLMVNKVVYNIVSGGVATG